MTDDFIPVLNILNISRQVIQIGVSEIEEITGLTELTFEHETIQIFPFSGLVQLHPGKSILVEESRLNLGQINNHLDKRFLRVDRTLVDPATLTLGN